MTRGQLPLIPSPEWGGCEIGERGVSPKPRQFRTRWGGYSDKPDITDTGVCVRGAHGVGPMNLSPYSTTSEIFAVGGERQKPSIAPAFHI